MNKVLVLGDGLLGGEIVKQTGWDCVSRKKTNFNVDDLETSIPYVYDTILNCIANTDTYSKDKSGHWKLNYEFVNNLIHYCNLNKIKLIHHNQSSQKTLSDEIPILIHIVFVVIERMAHLPDIWLQLLYLPY